MRLMQVEAGRDEYPQACARPQQAMLLSPLVRSGPPNDDFMDTLLTLLINAGNGPRISDGVDQATVPASRSFPYLSPPNPTAAGHRERSDLT